MKKILVLAALLLMSALAFLPVRSAWEKRRAEKAPHEAKQVSGPPVNQDEMSSEFLQEAWFVLLPVTRQKPDSDGNVVGVDQADAAMVNLQGKAQTRADWLVYSQISDYSLAKLLQSKHPGKIMPVVMRDPDECVSATMAAMRIHVLHARLPVCERVEASR